MAWRLLFVAGIAFVAGLSGCGGVQAPPTDPNYGTITTYAGTGVPGYTGDGGPAVKAEMIDPICVAENSADTLFIGDPENYAVRAVSSTGEISTFAGSGSPGYAGDGNPAVLATMDGPGACATDVAGNLYLADIGNNVIRRVSAAEGTISTVAGNGFMAGDSNGGFSGDTGPALQAEMSHPWGVAVDSLGNLYISDMQNERIRMVDATSGVITTIAGNGGPFIENEAYPGDGGKAVDAPLANPLGLAVDSAGNVYFADSNHNSIRRIDAKSGMITTVAGTGAWGYTGDGGAATKATFASTTGVTFDSEGNMYIADANNHVVRKVDVSSGVITTVVGNGTSGYSGDGGPATQAQLEGVAQVIFDSQGDMFIPDYTSGVVRKVTPGSH